MRTAEETLRIARILDARFAWMRGGMTPDKDDALARLFKVLGEARVAHALIGGVAVQLWRSEPRTTLDIDIAVASYESLPVEALAQAGFRHEGRFAHSDNWRSMTGVPVQFTDDPMLAEAIATAQTRVVGDVTLHVATPIELVRAKLRAARDAGRRRSKQLQDLADVHGLVEDHPAIVEALTPEERAELDD